VAIGKPRSRGLHPPPAHRHGLERRHVCVLFADITGFTRLVESVEPEVVYGVMRPLMDELVGLIHRHNGDIQQVLGDGFMSVFGLRVTDGDEVERAVLAGLALIATGGTAARSTGGADHPPVRVGIESGEVLVTPSWEPAGFGVWGRPVNLAKRLCDFAGPGEVQVGPAAFGRVGQRIWPATPAQAWLKGIAGPVVAHRLALDPPAAFVPAADAGQL
jgi:class 3 adenylate cyclase